MVYPNYTLRHTYLDNFFSLMFMGLEITSFAFYNRCTAKFWYACLRVLVVLEKHPTHSPQGITYSLLYHFQVHPK